MSRAGFSLLVVIVLAIVGTVIVLNVATVAVEPKPEIIRASIVEMTHGSLTASFRDNADELSGVRKLTHAAAPHVPAFGAGGLNYEHVISSAVDARNRFTPRKGPLEMRVHPHGVSLHRPAEESPWGVAAVMSYTITPPHFIDFAFEATITDASQFPDGEVTFFFASYMKAPEDYEITFRGLPSAPSSGGADEQLAAEQLAAEQLAAEQLAAEQWVTSKPTGAKSTTYAALGAPDLQHDPKDRWHRLHLTQEAYPRITQPFYFGRTTGGMVYAVMFDRLKTPKDEMRFSVFRWSPENPAWDFEYVARNVTDGEKVGFKGRLVWKPFVSRDEIAEIYADWKSQ